VSQDIDAMNAKIDVLFEQIAALDGDKRFKADAAVGLWRSAKTCEAVGLGPMEARHEYRAAYEALAGLGLEVGGMTRPYPAGEDLGPLPEPHGYDGCGETLEEMATWNAEAVKAYALAEVKHAVAVERERWAGVKEYLTAAADGSMSRNNSEVLAAELLAQIREDAA
jgi:hypothetical protein